jgi:hypothetical protein
LSHCWGDFPVVRLTNTSLASMMEGLPTSELPETFKDAMFITSKLGVRYLWIDSLCIIQDSVKDWQQESALMGSVYSGAICNIAATGAPNGQAGCFTERNRQLVQPLLTKATWSRNRLRAFVAAFSSKHPFRHLSAAWTGQVAVQHCCVDSLLWETGVETAPLSRRAWVVQEIFLAPRVLHFSSNQLFWECSSLRACETFPAGLPRSLFPWSTKGLISMSDWRKYRWLYYDGDPISDPYMTWDLVVSSYSKCQLTKSDDKLVALSGIAKNLQASLRGDIYLAGLWSSRLPNQLVWSAHRSFVWETLSYTSSCRRPESYRAPSWLWASLDGWISNVYTEIPIHAFEVSQCNILGANVTLLSDDPMGQVLQGYIRVRGQMTRVKSVEDTGILSTTVWLQGVESAEIRCMPVWDVGPITGAPIYFLIVLEYVEPAAAIDPALNMVDQRMFGLILTRSLLATQDFQRCGSFMLWSEEDCQTLKESCCFFQEKAKDERIEHIMIDGICQCTITIL